MKLNSHINKIVLMILIISLLLFGVSFMFGFKGNDLMAFFTEEYKYEEAESFVSTTEISSINLAVTTKNVFIKTHDKEEIMVNHYTKKGEEVLISEGEKILTILQTRKHIYNWYNFQFPKKEFLSIEILIPKDIVIDVKAYTSTGNVKIVDIKSSSINIKLNTGNIYVKDVETSELDIVNRTGNTTIKDSVVDDLNIKSTTGNVSISNITANNVVAQNNTGNINSTNIKATSVDLEATTGNITINENNLYTLTFETRTGNVKVNKKNHHYYYHLANGENIFKAKVTTGNIIYKDN